MCMKCHWLQNIAKVLHIVPASFLHAINSIQTVILTSNESACQVIAQRLSILSIDCIQKVATQTSVQRMKLSILSIVAILTGHQDQGHQKLRDT